MRYLRTFLRLFSTTTESGAALNECTGLIIASSLPYLPEYGPSCLGFRHFSTPQTMIRDGPVTWNPVYQRRWVSFEYALSHDEPSITTKGPSHTNRYRSSCRMPCSILDRLHKTATCSGSREFFDLRSSAMASLMAAFALQRRLGPCRVSRRRGTTGPSLTLDQHSSSGDGYQLIQLMAQAQGNSGTGVSKYKKQNEQFWIPHDIQVSK